MIFALRLRLKCSDLWELALTHDFNTPPQIADWPDSYVAVLRDGEFWECPDKELLEALCKHHEAMRFGQHIDLNIRNGFYFNPGDGQITIGKGSDCGHRIEVLDSVIDGIDITAAGHMSWSAAPFADHYVSAADDKMAWVFNKATGPWMLVAEYHERKGDEFYFLIVRFLSVADDKAFVAAFPEPNA